MPKETPKQIWLPKSELNVRVSGHEVEVYEHMVMELEPLKKNVGFDNTDDDKHQHPPPVF